MAMAKFAVVEQSLVVARPPASFAPMGHSNMVGFQFNPALALYIPIVQKWQATHGYFENAFRSSYVGAVIRVDFVARHGGDPETANELSAFVYMNWYHNDLAINWQKVIYAKDHKMPAHFYHTVGCNYWILCQNMKPRTMEQVAEEKTVALEKQGITIIDGNGANAKLLEKLSCNLCKIDDLECENEDLECEKDMLQEHITECEEELSCNLCKMEDLECENSMLQERIIECEEELNLANLANQNKMLDLSQELGVLQGKRLKAILDNNEQSKNLEAAYAKIEKLEETIQLHEKNSVHSCSVSGLSEDINTLRAREVSSQEAPKEAIVKFNCNACSARVWFTSGKETFADKKHLCHTCFVKTGAWLQ
jgi:hypothetical protein